MALTRAQGGKSLHVVTQIADPSLERIEIRELVDELLEDHAAGAQYRDVETVAATIFPADLYLPPAFDWSPQMSVEDQAELDRAADELFEDYEMALPIISSDPSWSWGTYFQRMSSWHGENQLARKIEYLRRQRKGAKGRGVRSANSADIAVGMEGRTAGVQIHDSSDKFEIGNPCLVHLDLTVHDRKLNMLATYRHWYMMGRAYGNLLGLARLQQFLAQQSGYPLGELVIVSGMTNIEDKWTVAELDRLGTFDELVKSG